MNFDRVNRVLNNTLFQEILTKINLLEQNRIFCNHGMEHMLDVARIMTIKNFEDDLGFDKELIYVTSLLHDIGRASQYENGKPHSKAGAEIALLILNQCGFDKNEIDYIVFAISMHNCAFENDDCKCSKREKFAHLLKTSDKLSRNCFCCKAIDECNWSKDKMNMKIRV